jgi:hypothetical protein
MGARSLKLASAVIALAGLAACHGPVNVVSVSSDAVMIRHTPDSSNVATDYANRYCYQYGKKARWRSSSSEPTNESLTIYDCVPY